jgi:hypothetical protein
MPESVEMFGVTVVLSSASVARAEKWLLLRAEATQEDAKLGVG